MTVTSSELRRSFPNDHSRQVDAFYYIDTLPFEPNSEFTFLDLGPGEGGSLDHFRKRFPRAQWIGVDIEGSPEVERRTRTDGEFRSYDGMNIPVEPGSIDVVFSRQVFEHVRYPELLLRSIGTALKPGGVFVGSVSQLECFHSFSYWNFTYYGLATLATDAGLKLEELRPGIDAFTLIARLLLRRQFKQDITFMKRWFREDSPLNHILSEKYRDDTHRDINRVKIQYSGHFCFKFSRPEDVAP